MRSAEEEEKVFQELLAHVDSLSKEYPDVLEGFALPDLTGMLMGDQLTGGFSVQGEIPLVQQSGCLQPQEAMSRVKRTADQGLDGESEKAKKRAKHAAYQRLLRRRQREKIEDAKNPLSPLSDTERHKILERKALTKYLQAKRDQRRKPRNPRKRTSSKKSKQLEKI